VFYWFYLFINELRFLLFCSQGLLQSEIVKDGSNKVGFFGKCLSHAVSSSVVSEYVMEDVCPSSGGSCARTEVLHL